MQLNVSRRDCVKDIDGLEADQDLNNLTDNLAYKGMTFTEKEAAENRFRTSIERAFPSASSIIGKIFRVSQKKEKKFKNFPFFTPFRAP